MSAESESPPWAVERAREIERVVRALVFDRDSGSRALVLSEEDAVNHIAAALAQARADALEEAAAFIDRNVISYGAENTFRSRKGGDITALDYAAGIRALKDTRP